MKLTLQDKLDICASPLTATELAAMYGVSNEAIYYTRKKGREGTIGYRKPKSQWKQSNHLDVETRKLIASSTLRHKEVQEQFGVSSTTVTNCRRAYPELFAQALRERDPSIKSHTGKSRPKVEIIALKVRQSIK